MELTRATKVDDGVLAIAHHFEAMKAAGVVSEHTQPGGVAFNDEITTFLVKFEAYLVDKYGLALEQPPDLSSVYTKTQADDRFVNIGERVKLVK